MQSNLTAVGSRKYLGVVTAGGGGTTVAVGLGAVGPCQSLRPGQKWQPCLPEVSRTCRQQSSRLSRPRDPRQS